MRISRSITAGLLLVLLGVAPSAAANREAKVINAEVKEYCSNIADSAADARYALQSRELKKLRDDIDTKIKLLEKKRAEYQDWVERRDKFLKMAQDHLVQIISKMRPDTAASQLALVGDAPAAAILMKLKPRVASPILNEMAPEKAAVLQRIMVGAGMADSGDGTQ
jgi:flagellar motility protein MotE (MotC chaperone)